MFTHSSKNKASISLSLPLVGRREPAASKGSSRFAGEFLGRADCFGEPEARLKRASISFLWVQTLEVGCVYLSPGSSMYQLDGLQS